MRNEPLVSVIVPVYNSEIYLQYCVESLINQTYKNLEIILVDDGSTDSSYKICDDYLKKDHRIIVIHTKNAGVASARNNGLKAANGSYISFVDSDDWIDTRMFEKMVNLLESDTDYPLITCRLEKTDNSFVSPFIKSGEISVKKYLSGVLSGQIPGEVTHCLFNAKYLKGIEFEKIKIGEDFIFMYNYLRHICPERKVRINNDILYYYRQHDSSAMHSAINKIDLDFQNFKKIIKKESQSKSSYYYILLSRYMSLLLLEMDVAIKEVQPKRILHLKNQIRQIPKKDLPWKIWGIRHRIMFFLLVYFQQIWNISYRVADFCTKKGAIIPYIEVDL